MASDKSGTLSPSCLLLVEMEKGGRGGALYLKSKLSLASLEKLGAWDGEVSGKDFDVFV